VEEKLCTLGENLSIEEKAQITIASSDPSQEEGRHQYYRGHKESKNPLESKESKWIIRQRHLVSSGKRKIWEEEVVKEIYSKRHPP